MKIIVLAHPEDDHAAPVLWALEQAGYQAACWSGVSWTAPEQASLLLDQQAGIDLGAHRLESGDVLWLRQPDQPSHPQSGPRERARFESYPAFFDSLAYMLENLPVRCINKYSASCLVRNKGVQLHLAGASGLKIPATLMSNSPPAVREFFDQNPGNSICKAFASHVWQQQGSEELSVTETFRLSREQLPEDDEVFTYAPAIYQQMVQKQYDVRSVLMGEQIYSFALRTPAGSLDWRHDGALGKLKAEAIPTPAQVESGILRFAEKTGACFGSIDFAVDRKGEWWFLEINEQGQFLWLDQLCPQAGLQQKFCAFLTRQQGTAQSRETRQEVFPSFSEYLRSHPGQQGRNITQASAVSMFKSIEP